MLRKTIISIVLLLLISVGFKFGDFLATSHYARYQHVESKYHNDLNVNPDKSYYILRSYQRGLQNNDIKSAHASDIKKSIGQIEGDNKKENSKNNISKSDNKNHVRNKSESTLPQLDNNSNSGKAEYSENSSFEISPELAARIANELDDSFDVDLNVRLKNKLGSLAKYAVETEINDLVTNSLSNYGRVEFSFDLGENWRADAYSLDYLLPVYGSRDMQFFSQLGIRRMEGRSVANFGLGYRRLYDALMLGANAFYDRDLTFSHERASLGFEAATENLKLTSNYYLPLSGWKEQSVRNKDYNVQARAAKGGDIKLTGYLPFAPTFSGAVRYFKWQGEYVDLGGDFHNSDSDSNSLWRRMGRDPKGYDIEAGWQPFPLFKAYVTRTISNQLNDTRLTFDFIYSFDLSLEEQLSMQQMEGRRIISDLATAMVERENNIILEYRASTSIPYQVNISIPDTNVPEGTISKLSSKIKSPVPIISYLWKGSGAQYLTSKTAEEPTFKAPQISENGSSRQYSLVLLAMDAGGKTTTSNKIDITVSEKNYDIIFYKDAEETIPVDINNGGYTSKLNWNEGKSGATIYWKFQKKDGSYISGNECTVANGCEASWHDPYKILENPGSSEPTIDGKYEKGAGSYEVKLSIKSDEGSVTYAVPVQIDASGIQSDIKWIDRDNNNEEIEDKTTITRFYAPDEPVRIITESKAFASNPDTQIIYSTDDAEGDAGVISDIAEDGSFKIKRTGSKPVEIRAVHSSTDDRLFEPTVISYKINIVADGSGSIKWPDADIKDGKLTVKYPGTNIRRLPEIRPEGPPGTTVNLFVKDSVPSGFINVTKFKGREYVTVDYLSKAPSVGLEDALATAEVCAKAEYPVGNSVSSPDPNESCFDLTIKAGDMKADYIGENEIGTGEVITGTTVTREITKDYYRSRLAIYRPYSINGKVNPVNPDSKDLKVTYSSSDPDIADFVDPTRLTLKAVSDKVITITAKVEDPDGLFKKVNKWQYKLKIIRSQHPGGLDWDDPDGRIDRRFMEVIVKSSEINKDQPLFSTPLEILTGDGKIAYQSSNDEYVTIDQQGRVTVLKIPGSNEPSVKVKITGRQLQGSRYEQSTDISYLIHIISGS